MDIGWMRSDLSTRKQGKTPGGQTEVRNGGWRIDYQIQIISAALKDKVTATSIYKDERFSDHALLIMDYDL